MPQARGTGTAIAAAQLGTWVNSGSWFGARDPMGLAKYSWVKVSHFAVRPPVLIIVCFGYVCRRSLCAAAGDNGIAQMTSVLHPARVGTTIGASWLESYVHPRTAPRSSG